MDWFWIYVSIYWNELIYIKFISSDIFIYKNIFRYTTKFICRYTTFDKIFYLINHQCLNQQHAYLTTSLKNVINRNNLHFNIEQYHATAMNNIVEVNLPRIRQPTYTYVVSRKACIMVKWRLRKHISVNNTRNYYFKDIQHRKYRN